MPGFDTFRDLERLSDQLLTAANGTARAPRYMPMDLYKVDDHYVVHADLPGADPGSIDLTVDHGVLTLSAQRTPRSDEGVQWIGSERPTGAYRRQITLGEGINSDGITATYENGVLTVMLPVAEQAKPRKIDVVRKDEHSAIEG